MRYIYCLLMAVTASACGSGSGTFYNMAEAKWADRTESCNRQFTTFKDRMIRWHYPDGTMDFGKIVKIVDASRSQVMLTVEPSSAINSAALRRPLVRLPDAITMGFEIEGERLRLIAIVGGDHGETGGTLDPQSIEYRLFNLVKCPS